MGTTPRTCHACQGPVAPRSVVPKSGLSTCGACRAKGVDPRDVEKAEMFAAWVEAEVTTDPDAKMRTADLWGFYLSWITQRDADWFYGKNRFVEQLEARGLGFEVRTKVRWYLGVQVASATVEPSAAETAVAP